MFFFKNIFSEIVLDTRSGFDEFIYFRAIWNAFFFSHITSHISSYDKYKASRSGVIVARYPSLKTNTTSSKVVLFGIRIAGS